MVLAYPPAPVINVDTSHMTSAEIDTFLAALPKETREALDDLRRRRRAEVRPEGETTARPCYSASSLGGGPTTRRPNRS